jgi:hypothetical protein
MLRQVYPGEGRVAQESYQVKQASPDHRPDAFITGVDDRGNSTWGHRGVGSPPDMPSEHLQCLPRHGGRGPGEDASSE